MDEQERSTACDRICRLMQDAVSGEDAAKLKKDIYRLACFYCDIVIPAMNGLRAVADELEMHIPQNAWPYPSIGDMIFKKV